jgi:hypothetical protein
MKIYTYKNISFGYIGGVNLIRLDKFGLYAPKNINGIIHWQLSARVRMSLRQFKKLK